MKKIMTSLACLAMVLVGGLALTACGGGPKEETITGAEFVAYIESLETIEFEGGLKVTMEESGEGKIIGQAVWGEENAMDFVEYVYAEGEENPAIVRTFVGDKAYEHIVAAETKYVYNRADDVVVSYSRGTLNMFRGNIKEMLVEETLNEHVAEDTVVKKVTDGKKVSYSCTVTVDQDGVPVETYMELVFENGKLVKIASIGTATVEGQEYLSSMIFEVYTGTITAPEGYVAAPADQD